MKFSPQLVRSGNRSLGFDGCLLASVSSKRPLAARWTDLELYRIGLDGLPSHDPSYVFCRTGLSRVYHTADCPQVPPRLPFGHEMAEQVEFSELVACHVCAPVRPPEPGGSGVFATDFATSHRFEVTRRRAWLFAGAPELLDFLSTSRSQDDRKVPMGAAGLPRLSSELLFTAARLDPGLAGALSPSTGVTGRV